MKRTVAVDANPLTRPVHTGTELYARELATRLPAALDGVDVVFYASRPAPTGVAAPDLTVLPMRRLWSQLRLPVELRRRRPDLFFAPSHVVPFLWSGPALTTVHDLAFERFPSAYSPGARAYLQATTRWAIRRCRLLLTVSESTRGDLAQRYGVDPDRVRVVEPGVGEPGPAAPEGRLAELGVSGRYVLHVGRIEPRKNQLGALAAVERLDGLTLVCAGPVIDAQMAARLRESGRALVLGRVSDPDRERLYRGAAALVFPSLYEGFGFPLLEAMSRGVPVVTVRASSLPEVGGDAVLYADSPHDVEGMSVALARVVDDRAERRRLVAAGRRRAAAYSWERTAAGVAAVITELLG